MNRGLSDADRFQRGFTLILVLGISLLFFGMIQKFLNALILAAILTGIAHPFYRRLLRWFGGRERLAAAGTLLIVLLVIVVPLIAFLGMVTAEAVSIAQGATPWIRDQIAQPSELERLIETTPLLDRLAPYHDQIATKLAELAGRLGTFLVNTLAETTKGTAVFFFQLFLMLYAMYFFLIDGKLLLDKILYYTPLTPEQEARMVAKFASVTRATIKGTIVIGILQGALAGLAFAVVGIKGAAFWGTIMAVLSIIPGIGTALIWLPATIYLLAIGRDVAAIVLFLWCALVVGTIDNLLRPRLVGRDTKMPDLLILLGTLGGLILFGAAGVLIGPIVAALFVTVWEIYGETFREFLPEVKSAAGNDESAE